MNLFVRQGVVLLADALKHFIVNRYRSHFAYLDRVDAEFDEESLNVVLHYALHADTYTLGLQDRIQHLGHHVASQFEIIFPYDVRWSYSHTSESFRLIFIIRDLMMVELEEVFSKVSTRKDLAHLKLQGVVSGAVVDLFLQLTDDLLE